MPDSSGQFKGISVSKLYPGHRDYVPPENPYLPPEYAKRIMKVWGGYVVQR